MGNINDPLLKKDRRNVITPQQKEARKNLEKDYVEFCFPEYHNTIIIAPADSDPNVLFQKFIYRELRTIGKKRRIDNDTLQTTLGA